MKNHFLPQFFIRLWAGGDGKVVRYHRINGKLDIKISDPAAVGWSADLYAVPFKKATAEKHALELNFMQNVDTHGARIVREMIATGRRPTAPADSSHWTRFLMTLINRSPQRLAEFKDRAREINLIDSPDLAADYEAHRQLDWPETLAEYLATVDDKIRDDVAIKLVSRLGDSPRIGTILNQTPWAVVETGEGCHSLLLSDAPMQWTNLEAKDFHFTLPVGPRHLFVGANNVAHFRQLKMDANSNHLIRQVNEGVVSRARTVVIAFSRAQDSFVNKRFVHNSVGLGG